LGYEVGWHALYQHKSKTYTVDLKSLEEIVIHGLTAADYWLTSRGRILMSADDMPVEGFGNPLEFMEAVEREVDRVLPTHICYEIFFVIESEGDFKYALACAGGEMVDLRPKPPPDEIESEGDMYHALAHRSLETFESYPEGT